MILSNVKQKCWPLPPGSAVNLNELNLIEIELFVKMLYGVWSLQPDHETNKSPRRMQVSPPVRNDDRSPIWDVWRPLISFSFPRISTKEFSYIKGKIDWSIGIKYRSVNFKWSQVFLCCQFLKIHVIQDKSKPTRVVMIWLRVKANRTRLCTPAYFARNEIKYQKSRESRPFQYILYACTITCLWFIPLYKQTFYKCYSLSPS